METGAPTHGDLRGRLDHYFAAVDELPQCFPRVDLALLESGGENLTAFTPYFANLMVMFTTLPRAITSREKAAADIPI